ncbi:MAG: glutamate racemase [Candidatus Omnitrophica bacterium]|nr:glutamate racemase [Candidatus Omnitrophota bacterium]
MDKRPIGVFDSGVGGLTVVKALLKTMPREDIIYLGDTARVPYGTKSKETVTRFSIECISFLSKFNIKLAVVACNTASSWSLNILTKKFDVPIIGVIKPGVEEACSVDSSRRIGVIGTRATVTSGSYVKAIRKIRPGARVYQQACPLFVPLVEQGWLDDPVTAAVCERYLKELRDKRIDTLILGCTHYPLLSKTVRQVFPYDIRIVDSSLSVSRAVEAFLQKNKSYNRSKAAGILEAFVTDDPRSFKNIARFFLERRLKVTRVNLL